MIVPMGDLRRHYGTKREDLDGAIGEVLQSGSYILGSQVTDFEREFASYLGAAGVVSVGNGTDAIRVALLAVGVEPGDEVITVANAGDPPPMAICSVGAVPVFVDVVPETMTMDCAQAAAALTPKTKAILPVHLYGQAAAVTELVEVATPRGVAVIEDCAQAHGAGIDDRKVGTIGALGCFSFYPTKNLAALGDGGAICSNDAKLLARARLIRQYGWESRYRSIMLGVNSRLDELQAAVLRVNLADLDALNARRRAIARRYVTELSGIGGLRFLPDRGPAHVWHLFVVRTAARDRLRDHLAARGVRTAVHYPVLASDQPSLRAVSRSGVLSVSSDCIREILSLPIFPELAEDEVVYVVQSVQEFFAQG